MVANVTGMLFSNIITNQMIKTYKGLNEHEKGLSDLDHCKIIYTDSSSQRV